MQLYPFHLTIFLFSKMDHMLVVIFFNLFWHVEMWTWTRRCLILSRAGRFVTSGEHVINMSMEVHINDALV